MTPSSGRTGLSRGARGMWLGLLGVALFGLTLPMTRLATGTADAPQLSPWFVTFGRAVLAGVLSAATLWFTRAPLPTRAQWKPLGLALLGNAIGYPLLLGSALRIVPSGHAAVVTALLPLATAVAAAVLLRQRARPAFWVCAVAGSLLVVAFMLLRSGGGVRGAGAADLLLLGAVLAAAVGYVAGAQLTPALGAERVICWVCVAALPITVPGMLWTWPGTPVSAAAWGGFVYVGLFSMWIGFFAWFRGLALGGALRVSQTQLLQPFFSIAAALPLLGEPIEPATLGFALAVVATVLAGRRLSAPRA
ncbi:DMT family transporter [Xylophilus sp.]|uniref:DMT family transporter n=1 Tax=Xylophilus sp. TaxID=2653893 RepID=UPI002D7FECBE|nr:DMT family transporter [Xylophilus sp.]